MEPKKNPKYDVHRQRGVLLNIGLIVSLIIVITAFKWTVPMGKERVPDDFSYAFQETLTMDDSRPTVFKKIELPKPKKIKVSVPIATNFISVSTMTGPESKQRPIDQGQSVPIDFEGVELPAEIAPPDTFRVVEKMPEPIGGWASFYKTLTKNFKYPKQAQRVGANGKVFVEFTVNDKGELSHFKIIKGIGYGCDEEAKRVIALTKWTAGKQRGRPVNVKMVQPIVFNME